MINKKALKILQVHQLWRRGKYPYDKGGENIPYSPKEIGEAIDIAIKVLKEKNNEKRTRR